MKFGEFSRRDALFGFLRRAAEVAPRNAGAQSLRDGTHGAMSAVGSNADGAPRTAVIQGRFCLAYRNLACSVCAERCPEPGAIVRERGIPRVVADACTGCGVCHEVCPAPRNAVLVLPRPRASTTTPHRNGIQR